MRFRSPQSEPPEINLIPFIDVLLVILIFLMLSTTYSKFTELQITLPAANADKLKDRPQEVIVGIAADGRFVINKQAVEGRSVDILVSALRQASGGNAETSVIISADAATPHQAVINVMDAARRVGLIRVTFAAQTDAQ
ncbi:ExbD/TolR family protein [Roseateles sp. LKC17W]|uniref:ExbD/TolR family protein n=1 Tax=Pelomonas margarita TaxID=3299031 RepID=A0ABW7FI56_9BURK